MSFCLRGGSACDNVCDSGEEKDGNTPKAIDLDTYLPDVLNGTKAKRLLVLS